MGVRDAGYISRMLIEASNHHSGLTAELMEGAASEIDLLVDEKADLQAEISRLTLSAAESQREEWRDGAADFACHLINNCELETITEEFIRQALVDFAKAAEAVRHE